jgi:hypothetical protein
MSVTSARVNDAARRPPLLASIFFAAPLAAAGPGAAPAAPGQRSTEAGRAQPAPLVLIHGTIIMSGEALYDAGGESKQRGGTHRGPN